MMRARLPWLVGVGLSLGAPGVAHAAAPGAPADTAAALAVPYVAQTVLLCGGAAVVMVERWYGRRGVYAQEFAHLVRPALNGILTTELLAATRSRGWHAEEDRGSAATLARWLAEGVPPIVLLEVAPDRYHYVVVLSWTATEVTFHDPAVGPFTKLPTHTFLSRWEAANWWTMLVRPTPVVAPADLPPVAAPGSPLPCRPFLDDAIDAAVADRLDDADRFLTTARASCPGEPLVVRELAGVRFRQGRHAEAAQLAREYLARAPDDSLGWQLLASSHYLQGEAEQALAAWNVIGRPTVDLVRIEGLLGTRYRVLADAMAIAPGTILTSRRFALAGRRLADVPAVALGRVGYTAVPGGLVELEAAVLDRPVLPDPSRLLLTGAARAATHQHAELALTSPLGAGEQWSLSWRWADADPRLAARLDIPGRLGIPGVVSVESSWDRYHFGGAPAEPMASSARRRATSLGFLGWVDPNVQARMGVRKEEWTAEGSFLSFSLENRLFQLEDRAIVTIGGEYAVPFGEARAYRQALGRLDWTSARLPTRTRWSARIGATWASATTPRGLWAVAGGDAGRAIPLRARQYAPDGLLPAARIGRSVFHAGLAGDQTVATVGLVSLGVGIFLDGADVRHAEGGSVRHRRYLDGGIGLLISAAGASQRSLRLDLARGLQPVAGWRLSLGLDQPWSPRRGAGN